MNLSICMLKNSTHNKINKITSNPKYKVDNFLMSTCNRVARALVSLSMGARIDSRSRHVRSDVRSESESTISCRYWSKQPY